MTDAFSCWEENYQVNTVDKTTVDFEPTFSVATRTQLMIIQAKTPNSLSTDTLDWSIADLQVHSRFALDNGEYVLYKNKFYKVIGENDYSDAGFFEYGIQSYKGDLTEITP